MGWVVRPAIRSDGRFAGFRHAGRLDEQRRVSPRTALRRKVRMDVVQEGLTSIDGRHT